MYRLLSPCFSTKKTMLYPCFVTIFLYKNLKTTQQDDFVKITSLIEVARTRAFHKVNEELVLLYFQVGHLVSAKVKEGSWGDNTVS